MNATKLMVIRDADCSTANLTLFKVAPEHAHPLSICMVFAERGLPVECGRHGQTGECVEAVVQEMLHA